MPRACGTNSSDTIQLVWIWWMGGGVESTISSSHGKESYNIYYKTHLCNVDNERIWEQQPDLGDHQIVFNERWHSHGLRWKTRHGIQPFDNNATWGVIHSIITQYHGGILFIYILLAWRETSHRKEIHNYRAWENMTTSLMGYNDATSVGYLFVHMLSGPFSQFSL